MARIRLMTMAIATVAALASGETAPAELPPHGPGTICITPTFWCWASPPGPPGRACYCPTPNGLVRGVLSQGKR